MHIPYPMESLPARDRQATYHSTVAEYLVARIWNDWYNINRLFGMR
jgi:hypothetical protein